MFSFYTPRKHQKTSEIEENKQEQKENTDLKWVNHFSHVACEKPQHEMEINKKHRIYRISKGSFAL